MVCHKLAALVHSASFIVLVILLATGPSSTWAVTIPSYNGSRVNWIATYAVAAAAATCSGTTSGGCWSAFRRCRL